LSDAIALTLSLQSCN